MLALCSLQSPPRHLPRAQEFRNETHWPKHLLVHYHWAEVAPVDGVAGLYALFALGAPPCAAVR